MQAIKQCLWCRVTVLAVIVNTLEENTNFIHAIQQSRGVRQVHVQIAIAHGAENIFQGMAEGFQLCETKETAGSLDGMNGAEGAGNKITVLR